MFDMLTGKYKNLASKGRYGDTMLAHINPQEAALLKSMGGAGTINPQTGLPEFYGSSINLGGMTLFEEKPKPSLGQVIDQSLLTLPPQLPTKFIPRKFVGQGKGASFEPEKTVVTDDYEKYKKIDYSFIPSKSGAKPKDLGYEIPVEGVKYQGLDLVGVYDPAGKFLHYTSPIAQRIDLGNGYFGRPFINASGGLTEFRQFKPNNEGMFEGLINDLGPLALAGLGANLFSGANLLAGTAGTAGTAGAAGALSPYAAQAAGAYGGSAAAASAAAAGNLAGIQAASAAQNALTQQALSNTGLTFGGDVPTATPDQVFRQDVKQVADLPPEVATETTASASDIAANNALAQANRIAQAAGEFTPSATTGLLSSLSSLTGLSPETLNSLAPSAIQGLLSAGGSYLQSEQAKEAAQTQADAQIRAAQIAADAARFRPVGVTTRFGSSNFQTDAAGNVIGAGYTPSAEILGYQNRLSALAGQGLTQAEQASTAYAPLTGAAQNLFSLGQGYLKKTPEEVAADYISKQQALLLPSQENQLALLQNKLFQQGRTGAATAQGGSLMATSPEMAAYYNSIAQQDLVLAAQADQEAQNRIKFGAGLFDTGANLQGRYYTGQTAAYAPFGTAMDTSSALESLAERPLNLGTSIGERTTAGTAAGGRFLSEGITTAAGTMAPADAYSLGGNVLAGVAGSPNVTGALNRAFGVQPQPTQQQYTFNPVTGQYVPVQQSVFAT
jgi:hypothetical protein